MSCSSCSNKRRRENNKTTVRPTLAYIEHLARQAGDILRVGFTQRPGFGPKLHVSYKSPIDPVTEFDRRSEAFIISEIQRHFPGSAMVTEESGFLDGHNNGRWYIDPLDGTVNYSHGVPIYAVSIAYAEDGNLLMGVVYDPERDECFSGELGRGAFLNGQNIRVSNSRELDQALLVTGFPYDIRTSQENNLANYVRFSLISQGVRRLGSAALDICYVAAGRFDGFWEVGIKPWDLAAGALIAREAGARVTDIHGGPDYLHPPCSIISANPVIYEQMKQTLDTVKRGN